MASLGGLNPLGTMNFPGPVGTKRRRMRSGGNVSTLSNNGPKEMKEEQQQQQQQPKSNKCKGGNTIPIFLKKTYKMIETSDPSVASWNEDGDMFIVKDPDVFAATIIPQYFDHNKFSSFARQLNFYGFRKMQAKPIRNSDFDSGTAKHVTFYNENFKRGRCDLLKKIQRSTRGGGSGSNQESAREVQALREKVNSLEQQLLDVKDHTEERVRRLEMDMLGRMEQMMLAMQQQQQTSLQLHASNSIGSLNSSQAGQLLGNGVQWNQSTASRANSSGVQSLSLPQQSVQVNPNPSTNMAPPTLPPHPKQKQLPTSGLPGSVGGAPDRLNSLRGISTLSRGISGLTRGASVESSASAVLMRNSWEDKFFSMLMLDAEQGGQSNGNADGNVAPVAGVQSRTSVTVSARSSDIGEQMAANSNMDGGDELSSVSTSDMP